MTDNQGLLDFLAFQELDRMVEAMSAADLSCDDATYFDQRVAIFELAHLNGAVMEEVVRLGIRRDPRD